HRVQRHVPHRVRRADPAPDANAGRGRRARGGRATAGRERRQARRRGAPARRAAPPQRASTRDPEARRLARRAPARLSAPPPGPLAGGGMPMTSTPDAVASAILLERDGAVLVITLNRPERRNAVNRQMWRALREAFSGARADAGVHAVVVTGSGGSFCAGQD